MNGADHDTSETASPTPDGEEFTVTVDQEDLPDDTPPTELSDVELIAQVATVASHATDTAHALQGFLDDYQTEEDGTEQFREAIREDDVVAREFVYLETMYNAYLDRFDELGEEVDQRFGEPDDDRLTDLGVAG